VAQSRAGSGLGQKCHSREQFDRFVEVYQRYPGDFQRVTDPPPWREVVVDKDINLFELMPLFRLNRGDGGYFIDKPCVVSRDPDDWDNDDVENVGVYRLQVKAVTVWVSRPCLSTTSPSISPTPKRRPRLAGGDHHR
jgi:UbiD family decarboxylase